MQYTANVNKITFWFILPFLFLLYFSYLMFDYFKSDNSNIDKILHQNKNNTMNKDNIHGVILGGSNAFFGLSAEILKKESGNEWLNLSLLNEGYSDENYWDFIGETLSEKQRLSISKVIYSSITPLISKDDYQKRIDSNQDLVGKKPIGLLPSISLISRLKGNNNTVVYPIQNSYGDFNFSEFECKFSNKPNHKPNINDEEIKLWVENQILKLESYFPNATIYFVIPSQFYTSDFNKKEILTLNKKIKIYIDQHNKKYQSKIIFIPQEDLPDRNFICDYLHHPNEEGRMWRTKNLSDHIFK